MKNFKIGDIVIVEKRKEIGEIIRITELNKVCTLYTVLLENGKKVDCFWSDMKKIKKL